MKTILDLRNDLDNNKVTSEELFKESKDKAKSIKISLILL